MDPQTVVAEVATILARRVAAGVYAPGELVPSVRQVAAEFEVSRATAQLILGRLESIGFVEGKRGKGFAVCDVRLRGGIDVYQQLFELSRSVPQIAMTMFCDIVDAEQALLLDTLYRYAQGDHRIDTADLHAAVDRLESIAGEPEPDLVAFLHAELAIIRRMLATVDQSMHLATVNSIGQMILAVPEALAAFFAVTPDAHVVVWRALVGLWENGGSVSNALVQDLSAMYHNQVIARFAELVGVQAPRARAANAS